MGSGQEMDKTVRPKAKADNTLVCEVPGLYTYGVAKLDVRLLGKLGIP